MHVKAVIERAGSGNRKAFSRCRLTQSWSLFVEVCVRCEGSQKDPEGKACFTRVCCGSRPVVAAGLLWRQACCGGRSVVAAGPLSRRGVHGANARSDDFPCAKTQRSFSKSNTLCGLHSKSLNTHLSWSDLISSGQTDNGFSVWRQNPPHKETPHGMRHCRRL